MKNIIKKINTWLVIVIIFLLSSWLYLVLDNAGTQRQLKYQIQYRIALEKENDVLKGQIRSYQAYLPDNADKPFPEYIEWKIKTLAAKSNIDPDVAFAIAICESTLNPYAKNPNSTAKGLFQFLDGTWSWIGANGSPYDVDEQIRQFMIWYPKDPQWWKNCLNKIN
jgi:soluble lytic murein transglycosylase-like protein